MYKNHNSLFHSYCPLLYLILVFWAISCYRPRGNNSFQTISKITILLSFSGFAFISVTRHLNLNIACGECIAQNFRILAPLRNKLHFNQTCFIYFIKFKLRCFI